MNIGTEYCKGTYSYRERMREMKVGAKRKLVPFEIHALEGYMANKVGNSDLPRQQLLYEIIWMKKGSGTLLVDLQKIAVNDNMIYCIKPGQLHFFQINGDIEGYCLSFSEEFLEKDQDRIVMHNGDSYQQNPYLQNREVTTSLRDEIEDIFQAMEKEYACDCRLGFELIRELLSILIFYLTRDKRNNKQNVPLTNHTELTRNFLHLLNSDLSIKKTVRDYACELSITPNYLNQIVKKVSGFTASHHIQQYKVLQAKRHAIYFGNSMKDIAYSLGFDDLSHFSKFFKKNAGTSFREFKNDTFLCDL